MTRKPTLLIVTDERDLRTKLEMAFAYDENGYEVSAAPSGKSARLQIRVVHPDVVLLDINLPDGWDTLRSLRKAGRAPIILLAADDVPGTMIRGLEEGAAYCVPLSVPMPELRARVRSLLAS